MPWVKGLSRDSSGIYSIWSGYVVELLFVFIVSIVLWCIMLCLYYHFLSLTGKGIPSALVIGLILYIVLKLSYPVLVILYLCSCDIIFFIYTPVAFYIVDHYWSLMKDILYFIYI